MRWFRWKQEGKSSIEADVVHVNGRPERRTGSHGWFEKPRTWTLADLVGRAALGAAFATILLLVLGLLAELLRRRRRARRLLALLDLTLPTGVRTVVVALLALLSTFVGPRPAGADDSVRGWLHSAGRPPPRRSCPWPRRTRSRRTTDRVGDRDDGADRPGRADPADDPRAAAGAGPCCPRPRAPVVAGRLDDRLRRPARRLPLVDRGTPPRRSRERGRDRRGWRAIYAANRAAIGDDPNLIHLGLTLALPPLDAQP